MQATLDFDRLVVVGNGVGSAQLKPDGRQHVTGAVSSLTPRAMVGEAVIRGEPGRTVRIDLPRSITLYGAAGGTLRLESIESDLSALPRLDSNGMLTFRFGGILQLDGSMDGEFRGDVRIDVDYF